MAITAARSVEKHVTATVSDATRKMSRPAGGDVLSFSEEFDQLSKRKRDIEQKLGRYSRAAMCKEQARIRSSGGNTLQKWINRKLELEAERRLLIDEKANVESRMCAIKDSVTEERRQRGHETDLRLSVLNEILSELVSIRQLLVSVAKDRK